MLWGWKKYKVLQWGKDDIQPLTGSYREWLGLGATIVDALDTLYIMDLKAEFQEARKFIEDGISFQNVFISFNFHNLT